MPAGTLTLTNNSVVVKGTGTAFNTELKAGDFIVSVVGGVTYTLPVKTVDSATQATLIKAYDGPTQAGAAWYAVPRDAMNTITAQLAAETAKALRGLNLDKNNWQQVFSGTGNITVTLPDGSTYTGPAWNSFTAALNQKAEKKAVDDLATDVTKKLSDKADKTALNDKADKKSLGSAAGATLQSGLTDATPGRVATVGAFGVGIKTPTQEALDGVKPSGLYSAKAVLGGIDNNSSLLQVPFDVNTGYQIIIPTTLASAPKMYLRLVTTNPQYNGQICEVITTSNTTTDANGFIKKASPIARVSDNPENMTDNYLDGFVLSGLAAVNQDATGVSAEKIDTGIYVISGAAGLAKEGWDFEIPQDSNGNRLCFVTTEVNDNGEIIVRVSKRKVDFGTATVIAGEPMDIPAGRWIDFRLEMPIKDKEKNK
ncbi:MULTISPECIES: phage tail fiber protein [Serratia]|uniref:phage tail fiber protein n=1 Tax=Serratia TaxID=613 RepID=UPI000ABCC455|nr:MULTISPECIES: hypothetical protein [Serratia]WLS21731.1 hypothetical protein RAA91_11470 [Serratia marcescens]CAE7302315.1 hypothetical protein AI2618V1_2076 [Serratia marcescens]CAE7302578.1 hypothetical protein AI2617V1_2069 [Serratia marcescens]CAH3667180.1 hypothetical protein AI2618V1_2076 [Serratia marcescens]CAH3956770.1 hypothetical protein AI2617V1_2069 [Serratia marcescens]